MNPRKEQAELLTRLHAKGDPLILFNIWDAGSAKMLEEIGAKVIHTASWSVAASHGFADGENLPLDLTLANLKRIVASVHLPVSHDFEGGYGKTPEEVGRNAAQVMEAGAVGINFEDQIIGGEGLYPTEDQCARIRAIRQSAREAGIPLFINARTDLFLKSKKPDHNRNLLKEALDRAAAYAQSGASGFFIPGLCDRELIKICCKGSRLPVNILMLPDAPSIKELSDVGVARISYGPFPYRHAMAAFKEMALGIYGF